VSQDRIIVPHLSAPALIAQAKEKLILIYCNSNLKTWKFGTPDRATTYEVHTWPPDRTVTSEEVRAYFRERGFIGNTAAFIAWVTQQNPADGYYTSIPEDDQLWRGPESRVLCAPCFDRGGSYRGLGLRGVRRSWYKGWVFVAFRELPQST